MAQQSCRGCIPAGSNSQTTTQPIPFPEARRAADKILSQREFRTVAELNPMQRGIARLESWIDSFFTAIGHLGDHKPWLVPVIEWSCFGIAIAAVLVWAFRIMQRQQLAIQLEAASGNTVWRAESDNWVELARKQAAALAWRDAVHSLYWATIVMLEGRRFWRPNRARTPREYLRLFEPGSARRETLGGLTGIFERIWYGNRAASQSDYDRAQALFETLRSG